MQCASAQCWYAALCIWILDLQLFKDRAESCDPLSATRTIVNSLRSNASWWRIWAILAGDQPGHRLMIPIPPLQSSLKLVAGTQTSRDPQLWDGWSKSKTRIFGGSGRIRSLRRGSMSGALVLQHLRPRTPIGESSSLRCASRQPSDPHARFPAREEKHRWPVTLGARTELHLD
jgi:hypothetical protein